MKNRISKFDAAVVVVVNEYGQYLLLHRTPDDPIQGWGLAGGMLDDGELSIDAAKREVFEETGIEVALTDLYYVGEGKSVGGLRLSVYACKVRGSGVVLSAGEHDGYCWTLNTIGLHLAGNTQQFIDAYINKMK